MTSEDARQYFKDKGLTYKILNPYTIDLLVNMLDAEILKMRLNMTDCVLLRINKHNHYALRQFETLLTVKGTYFERREAISFNHGGFIGFAGWASDINKKPFVDGFVKWCDVVAEHTKDGAKLD